MLARVSQITPVIKGMVCLALMLSLGTPFSFQQAVQAQEDATGLTVFVRIYSGDPVEDSGGFFVSYDEQDPNRVVVMVRDADSTPVSGAAITLRLDPTGGSEQILTGFEESDGGVYTLALHPGMDFSGSADFLLTRIADDPATVTVEHPDLSAPVTVETTIRHIDPTGQFRIPPPGYAIDGYHNNPIAVVDVDGALYSAYPMRYDNAHGTGSLWLIVDQAGQFPDETTYARALLAVFADQYLNRSDAAVLRDIGHNLDVTVSATVVVELAQWVRDASAQLLGSVAVDVATGQMGTATARKLGRQVFTEFVGDLAEQIVESYDGSSLDSVRNVVKLVFQTRLDADAAAAFLAADLLETHSGPWSAAEAERLKDAWLRGVCNSRVDINAVNTLLPDTEAMTQMQEIATQITLGALPAEAEELAELFLETSALVEGMDAMSIVAETMYEIDECYARTFGPLDAMIETHMPQMLAAYGGLSPMGPSVVLMGPQPGVAVPGEATMLQAYILAQDDMRLTVVVSVDGSPFAPMMSTSDMVYEYEWIPPDSGEHTVVVRVMDAMERMGEHHATLVAAAPPAASAAEPVANIEAPPGDPSPGYTWLYSRIGVGTPWKPFEYACVDVLARLAEAGYTSPDDAGADGLAKFWLGPMSSAGFEEERVASDCAIALDELQQYRN